MTSKLTLYCGALLELGERELASLSENVEARRQLDRAWDAGAINFCLSQAGWKWALRSVEMTPDVGVTPSFGYANAFEIPSDHLKTHAVCSDEYMQNPLTAYSTEQNYIFADANPVYMTYVSNDATYGMDYSLWPEDFIEYVHAYLASKIAKKLTQSQEDLKTMIALADKRLRDAKSSNAMEGPTVFPPVGNWVSARLGRSSGRRDRGSRGSLIG